MTSVDCRSKHAIVGAGFSGLGVAAAFQRAHIAYDVLEAKSDLGGNWLDGVYETVHIISSRRTTEYSDFPMPAHWPDFPSKDQMLSYLRAYADHAGLRPHLSFDTKVQLARPMDDGSWELTLATGERRTYGGVVICNGHHWDKRLPEYPGSFAGPILHSKDYKSRQTLEGKRVLVIGGGNSACDIAVEAGRFAASSHISLRRGYWFLPKTMFGIPTVEVMKPWMPLRVQQAVVRTMVRIIVGKYQRYGLPHPDHRPFEHHPTINSELLYSLRHGRITPHPDVSRFEGNVVHFVDGTSESFDLVIAATGYHVSFPFVAEGVISWKGGMPELMGGVVPPGHKNLYVFGVGQPRYGAGPLISAGAELLCAMVRTQQKLRHPLSDVLQKLGARAPRTYLQDPFAVLRQIKMSKRILSRLATFEPLLMRS